MGDSKTAIIFIIIFTIAFLAGFATVLLKKVIKIIENACEYAVAKDGVKLTKEFNMVAHRGLSSVAPENSVSAFKLATEAGFKYVECDVRLTKDKKWIVMHDSSVDRTTNGIGEIGDKTLEEIRALRIDRGSGIDIYDDEKVPTFEEYLATVKAGGAAPVIEIKQKGDFDYEEFIEILRAFDLTETAVVIDYDIHQLKELRKLCPELKMQILCKWLWSSIIEEAENIGNCGIDVMQNLMRPNKNCRICKEKGITLNGWTVDKVKTLEKLHKMGGTFATTNCLMPIVE